jgi:hypothetical protein
MNSNAKEWTGSEGGKKKKKPRKRKMNNGGSEINTSF